MPFRQGVSLIQGRTPITARVGDHADKRLIEPSRAQAEHGRGKASKVEPRAVQLGVEGHEDREIARARVRVEAAALERGEQFRSELHRAEAALRRTGPGELASENSDFWLQIYADLIDCATTSLYRMRSAISSREVADRFETATDVQMLEELIAQWTSRMQLIRQSTADGGHDKV